MARPTLANVVRAIRPPKRTRPDASDESDADLLARFVQSRDEAAFRALVQRHGPTVLAACRQVLSDPADIDDAFQATFLVLLKKAKAVAANPAPLAGWLYAVAHRVAVRCRADRHRRTARETEAARRAGTATELPDLSWREATDALHEELNGLPDKYRLPLLLCGVRGLTRDEAAEQLGTSVGAVRGQLERGRALLERRLAKRGIALAAGWLAVVMECSRAAGVPSAQLIDLAARLTGDSPSAVVALAHGAFPMIPTLKPVAVAVSAVLLAFGLTVGMVSPQPAAHADDKPALKAEQKAEQKADKKEPAVKGRTFTGTVMDADGKPVKAELLFLPKGGDVRAVGRADEKGHFAVTVPEAEVLAISHLLARADGHGFAGVTVWDKSPAEVRLVLPKDLTVRGRVIDLQGKPVAGATLTPLQFTAADAGHVDNFLKIWSRMTSQENAFQQDSDFPDCTFDPDPKLTLSDGRRAFTATTDKDGMFELVGFGAERVVELLVRGPGIADTQALVVTRTGFDPDPVNRAALKAREQYMLAKNGPIPSPARLHGPAPTFVVDPDKPLGGVVTDAESGLPRAGVRVTFRRLADKGFQLIRPHEATTDTDGRFAIRGGRKYGTYLLETDADPAGGYAAASVKAEDTPGHAPIDVVLTTAKTLAEPQPKGVPQPGGKPGRPAERVISGTVVGHDGKPVKAELTLIWQEGKSQAVGGTAADGTFKVTVPMTRGEWGGWLVANAPGHGFDFVAHGIVSSPRTLTPTAEVAFKLPKERQVKGRLLDQQGKPLAGATVVANRFTAYDSDASRDAHFHEWAVSGSRNGSPPYGDKSMWYSEGSKRADDTASPHTAVSDTDGRFEIAGVGEKQLFHLRVSGPGVANRDILVFSRDGFDPAPLNKQAKDNEIKGYTFGGKWQLHGVDPTVVLEPEKIIRGTVTGPDGKPRGGVTVAFTRPNKRDLTFDWTQAITDKDGKYEIRGARKHTGYMVEVPADTKAGLLPCQAFADDTVGYEPITIDIKQAKGIVVSGTVRNKATREPVEAYMYAEVMANNPFVGKYPPFLHSASGTAKEFQADKDGKYRLVTVPGRVMLMAAPRFDGRGEFRPPVPDPKYPDVFKREGGLAMVGGSGGYLMFDHYGGGRGFVQGNWCKVLEAKETDTELTVDIDLEPATKTAVKVADADGKPVTGVSATGLTHVEFAHPTAVAGDTLTVYNLDLPMPEPKQSVVEMAVGVPKEKPGRLVAVYHPEKKLVGTLTLTPADKNPVVTLTKPGSVTGRVVGKDGKPLTGLTVHLWHTRREVTEAFRGLNGTDNAVTDANGEFRFDNLFPDQTFQLSFYRGKVRYGPDHLTNHKLKVQLPGMTSKLTEYELQPEKTDE